MSQRTAFECNMYHLEDCVRERKKNIKFLMTHLNPKSQKFKEICYQLWTCDSVIQEIDIARKVPFYYTPQEILDEFSERMVKFIDESPTRESSYGFRVAVTEAGYLKEKYEKRKEAIRCGEKSD